MAILNIKATDTSANNRVALQAAQAQQRAIQQGSAALGQLGDQVTTNAFNQDANVIMGNQTGSNMQVNNALRNLAASRNQDPSKILNQQRDINQGAQERSIGQLEESRLADEFVAQQNIQFSAKANEDQQNFIRNKTVEDASGNKIAYDPTVAAYNEPDADAGRRNEVIEKYTQKLDSSDKVNAILSGFEDATGRKPTANQIEDMMSGNLSKNKWTSWLPFRADTDLAGSPTNIGVAYGMRAEAMASAGKDIAAKAQLSQQGVDEKVRTLAAERALFGNKQTDAQRRRYANPELENIQFRPRPEPRVINETPTTLSDYNQAREDRDWNALQQAEADREYGQRAVVTSPPVLTVNSSTTGVVDNSVSPETLPVIPTTATTVEQPDPNSILPSFRLPDTPELGADIAGFGDRLLGLGQSAYDGITGNIRDPAGSNAFAAVSSGTDYNDLSAEEKTGFNQLDYSKQREAREAGRSNPLGRAAAEARKASRIPASVRDNYTETMQRASQESDLENMLGIAESSDDYTAESPSGSYLGRYQMGTMALQDAEVLDADGNWEGGSSREEFLNDPQAQDYAFTRYTAKNLKAIKNKKLDERVGTEFRGVKVTLKGLQAAAHLVGVTGLANMFKTGRIPTDGNGTKALSYLQMGSSS